MGILNLLWNRLDTPLECVADGRHLSATLRPPQRRRRLRILGI